MKARATKKARDRSRAFPYSLRRRRLFGVRPDALGAPEAWSVSDAYSASESAISAGSGSIASSRCWASCSSRLAATRCRLRR